MAKWQDMTQQEVLTFFQEFGRNIRTSGIRLGRHDYAPGMAHGMRQSIHCGYPRVTAVELGVFTDVGLLEPCDSAKFFMDHIGNEIDVYGFDNAVRLSPLEGYIDHPVPLASR